MRQNTETNPAETEAATNGWRVFPMETFVKEGILALANATFFWPNGLALTVIATRTGPGDRDFDWADATLRVTGCDPPDEIVSGRDDIDELLARAEAYLQRHRSEFP